ncbi:MAG: HIT family protein [Candidatus Marinimicrobia bacterium]|nr:HIT family protein [Candidatus Neomarinimicrobiota bacterium]MBL7010808.1 HIT family protein [Candidatus Neomarinimicrobiota bacterium]MBL7031008.1 HIT family protein [Candidatus Neomarinimicrobiota bacterium]
MTSISDKNKSCPFCQSLEVVAEHKSVFAIKDNFPVTKGHHLIIPFRHTENYFSMTDAERDDATALLNVLKIQLEEGDTSIVGFNIGMNSGEAAGQTVMHSHIHLMPRRKGDTPNPRGGVRGVIPGKMDY